MKKLILLFSLFSVSNMYAHAECDAAIEYQEVAQKVTNGIFSDQFIMSLITLAKQSQTPVKDFLRSSFALTQLNKEQLTSIKNEVKALCDLYPQATLLGMQYSQEKSKQLKEFLNKEFAQEVAQNKCLVDDCGAYVNTDVVSGQEAVELQEKIDAQLAIFESQFEALPIAIEFRDAQNQLGMAINKCIAILPSIRSCFDKTMEENEEQLQLVGVMLLKSLIAGVSDTVSQAIDECISEEKNVKN